MPCMQSLVALLTEEKRHAAHPTLSVISNLLDLLGTEASFIKCAKGVKLENEIRCEMFNEQTLTPKGGNGGI